VFAHPAFGGNQVGMVIATQAAVQTFSGVAVAFYSLAATCLLLMLTRVICGGVLPADDESGDGENAMFAA